MTTDYFESSTLSLILSWVFSIPILIGLLGYGGSLLLEKQENVSWFYTVWFMVCILLFSPLRYMMWQIIAAICYSFSGVGAFFSALVLTLYVPIVFGLLYIIGIGIPIMLIIWIALGFKEEISKARLWLSALLLPIVLQLGTFLFFLALPLGASTIHWIKMEDVIRASNGPAYVTFKYVVKWWMPIQIPKYADMVAKSDKDQLRAHMALIYLSDVEHAHYVQLAYPEFYDALQNK